MKRSRFIKAVFSAALLIFLLISSTAFAGNKMFGIYHPKLMKNMTVAKKTLNLILNNKCGFGNSSKLYFYVLIEGHKSTTNGFAHYEYSGGGTVSYSKALVFDDRIELSVHKGTRTIYFSNLFDGKEILDFRILQNHWYGRGKYYYATIGSKQAGFEEDSFHHHFNKKNDFDCFKRLADALFTIKKDYGALVKQKDSLFKTLAQEYRALKVKPVMSEEQRKNVVLANLLTRQKKYAEAIIYYRKVINLNPTSYPAAYNNLALLEAQIHNYNGAVFYMKEYLLLVPNSKIARAAKDKIYEWNFELHQQN